MKNHINWVRKANTIPETDVACTAVRAAPGACQTTTMNKTKTTVNVDEERSGKG